MEPISRVIELAYERDFSHIPWVHAAMNAAFDFKCYAYQGLGSAPKTSRICRCCRTESEMGSWKSRASAFYCVR